jgi:hypothetical protein
MVRPSYQSHRARRVTHPLRPILADTITKLSALSLHLRVCARPRERSSWFDADALASPHGEALTHLLHAFKRQGIAPNQKAASASLLLRLGWAGGFAIGAYLICRRVPTLVDYAVSFSPTMLLRSIWVRDARFVGAHDDPLAGRPEWIESVEAGDLRRRLVESLVLFTEPVVATQHAWSGFSRHALWAMVTSSWAEQFANIARQIGDEPWGVGEAKAVFELVPELDRAAPELYDVRGGQTTRTCQRRSACCLYFKSSARYFCASCPIITEFERLERNRAWVARQQLSEPRLIQEQIWKQSQEASS